MPEFPSDKRGKALYHLAECYQRKGMQDKASDAYAESASHFQQSNQTPEAAQAYSQAGYHFSLVGKRAEGTSKNRQYGCSMYMSSVTRRSSTLFPASFTGSLPVFQRPSFV
jgi:hypothetical protein